MQARLGMYHFLGFDTQGFPILQLGDFGFCYSKHDLKN